MLICGTTHAWEQHTFKDLYVEASEGGTPSTSISSFYENGTIPFVKIEDTNSKYIYDTETHITEAGMNNSSAWLIPENSVIFTNGATVGNVAINKLKVTTKQGILGKIPSSIVNYEFLYYLLSSVSFQKEVRRRIAKGTFETIILNNLNTIEVLIPKSIEEQSLIANELANLDSLLTLHQDSILCKLIQNNHHLVSSLKISFHIYNVWRS